MKRSSWASGRGYVPSDSIGFCVAMTRKGSGTSMVSRPMVTWRSCITSSSALCTLAGARLISSASRRLVCTGPSEVWNSPRLLVVDPGADEVGRHQVGRELDALELPADRLGQRLDGHRLGQAGHALDEDVAAREQGDDQPLQQCVLADDELLDLVDDVLHRQRTGHAGVTNGLGELSVTAPALPRRPWRRRWERRSRLRRRSPARTGWPTRSRCRSPGRCG